MLADLGRTSEAFLVFSLIVVAPGYVLAWCLNILAFRRRMLLTRLTITLPVSIGICPTITYLVWRFLPPAVLALYGACAVAFIVLMFYERRELLSRAAMRTFFKRGRVFLAIIGGWVVLAELRLADLQIGRRLYFPTVSYDYSFRSAVTSSITRSGIPAHNPFSSPAAYSSCSIINFWLTLCSLAERMTGSSVSSIYQEMKRRTPAGAVFQHTPHTAPEDFFEGLYGDRQVVAEGLDCSVFFGGDASVCQSRIGAIGGLFENPKAFDATQIDEVCARNSINVLVVKDTDKVWQDRGSWVWNRTPIVENSYARAFMCGPALAPPSIRRSNSTTARR
jgi:hypothetical protein